MYIYICVYLYTYMHNIITYLYIFFVRLGEGWREVSLDRAFSAQMHQVRLSLEPAGYGAYKNDCSIDRIQGFLLKRRQYLSINIYASSTQ